MKEKRDDVGDRESQKLCEAGREEKENQIMMMVHGLRKRRGQDCRKGDKSEVTVNVKYRISRKQTHQTDGKAKKTERATMRNGIRQEVTSNTARQSRVSNQRRGRHLISIILKTHVTR